MRLREDPSARAQPVIGRRAIIGAGDIDLMQVLLRWAVGAVGLYLTVQLAQAIGVTGLELKDWGTAFIAVLLLTLVNAFIRPIVRLITLPLNCLTLGLFGLVVNALMFWLVGALEIGLRVDGFLAALFGSVVLSIISGILNTLITERDGRKR